MRILLVEDSKRLRETVAKVMRRSGYKVGTPLIPALRSDHPLIQRPSPQKQIPSIR